MSDREVTMERPFGVLRSDAGVLVMGPMEFGAVPDDGFADGIEHFRRALEEACRQTTAPIFRFDGPLPDSVGNVVISVPGPTEFSLHRLDGALGTFITWGDATERLAGADATAFMFERAGVVFEARASFGVMTIESLERLDAAAYVASDRWVDEGDAREAGQAGRAIDFSRAGLQVPWHGQMSFNTDDVFAVMEGETPVAAYIADGWEEEEFPHRDSIRCRPAPPLAKGAPIEAGSLESVDLRGAVLAGWDLSGVSFSHADLRGADFTGCALAGARFAHARADGAVFDRADLSGTDWSFAFAPGARFVDAKLDGATFYYAELEETIMRGASLRGTNLDGIEVARADWSRVDLTDAVVGEGAEAFITDTDLSHAIVAGAEFGECDLSGSVLEGVDLSSATLEDVTLPDGLEPSP